MKERIPFGILSVLAVADTLFGTLVLPGGNTDALVAGFVLQMLGAVLIGFSDRLPAAAGTVPFIVGTLLLALGPEWRELYSQGALLWMPVSTAIVSANLVRFASRPAQFVTGAAGLTCWVISASVSMTIDGAPVIITVLAASAPILAGACVSLVLRLRRAQHDKLHRARQERELADEKIRRAEREKLAEELHDTVTHHVTLLVMQANVIAATAPDTDLRGIAATMGDTGRSALEELREFVGVLRQTPATPDGSGEQRDTPSKQVEIPTEAIRELVEKSRHVAPSIELATDAHSTTVTEVVARTLVRLTQEGLTNLHKHAPGTRAFVTLVVGHDSVRFEMRNEVATGSSLATTGSGNGLSALARRVELLGGRFHADCDETGEFVLSAQFPQQPVSREGASQ